MLSERILTGSLVHNSAKTFHGLKSDQHQISLCYILMCYIFSEGRVRLYTGYVYKTHSSRELRMQSHKTNSIASLTTSPQYVFFLPLIPCSTEVSRASPSTVFSINRATRFSWKKVHKEKSLFLLFSFPCFLSFSSSTHLGG